MNKIDKYKDKEYFGKLKHSVCIYGYCKFNKEGNNLFDMCGFYDHKCNLEDCKTCGKFKDYSLIRNK